MKTLTKVEEEIMQMIWEHEPTTVTELIQQMPDPKPPHSSISSQFRILEKKGFVDHRPKGRSFEYFSIISQKNYSQFSVRKLVSKYFEGSMSNLVSFLVKEEDVDLQEIKEIREIIRKNEEL